MRRFRRGGSPGPGWGEPGEGHLVLSEAGQARSVPSEVGQVEVVQTSAAFEAGPVGVTGRVGITSSSGPRLSIVGGGAVGMAGSVGGVAVVGGRVRRAVGGGSRT